MHTGERVVRLAFAVPCIRVHSSRLVVRKSMCEELGRLRLGRRSMTEPLSPAPSHKP